MDLLPKSLNGDNKKFFEARLGLDKALKLRGEYVEAHTILLDVLQILEKWENRASHAYFTPILVETLRELADVRQRAGSFDEALNYLELGLHHLNNSRREKNRRLWRRLMDRIVWIRFRQGDLRKALLAANAALESSKIDKFEETGTLASLYNTVGGISWQKGHLSRASEHLEHSLKLYREDNNLWGMGVTQTNLGVLHDIKGEWSKAVEYYEKAYKVQKDIGDLDNQACSLDNLGVLHMALGDYEATRRDLEAALAIREQLGESLGVAQSRASLAQIALFEKRFDDAACHANISLELAVALGAKEIEVYARWILAMVQAECGDLPKGLQTAMQAWHLARIGGYNDEKIDCLRIVGLLLARGGDFNEAEQSLQVSLDLSREQSDPYRQGLALLELGRVFLNHLEKVAPELVRLRNKAINYFREAITIFQNLGSEHNLRQAKAELNKCLSK